MTEAFVTNTQIFLLVLFRIIALVQVAPLTSSSAIPQVAKIGFALFVAAIVFPGVLERGYAIPGYALHYLLLLLGEVLVGIILGFFLVLIFAAFQLAGQMFSLQMGFGASHVFDPLSQVQIPLIGQFLNIVGMLVFLSTNGFNKLVLVGVERSFGALKAVDLVAGRAVLFDAFLGSLGHMFEVALMISFPILGTLFLISVSTGLLAKAAPQMNLLMMGFPMAIGMAFVILFLIMPYLMTAFARLIDATFEGVMRLMTDIKGAVP